MVNIWSLASSARPHPPQHTKREQQRETMAHNAKKKSVRVKISPSHPLPLWGFFFSPSVKHFFVNNCLTFSKLTFCKNNDLKNNNFVTHHCKLNALSLNAHISSRCMAMIVFILCGRWCLSWWRKSSIEWRQTYAARAHDKFKSEMLLQ